MEKRREKALIYTERGTPDLVFTANSAWAST